MKKDNPIKVAIINYSKKNVFFRKILRKALYVMRFTRFKIRGLGIRTKKNTAIFFAFKGQSYSCSPKAIYEYMLTDSKYDNFEYVWAFKEPEKYKFLEENKNTKVIKYAGKNYEKTIEKVGI